MFISNLIGVNVLNLKKGQQIILSKLEIQIFCNKNYIGDGISARVIEVYKDRAKVKLGTPLIINGYKYDEILINDKVKYMTEGNIEMAFRAQERMFNLMAKAERKN